MSKQSTPSQDVNNQLFNIKLPQLNLPQFDGAYDKWWQFRDTFNSLIHSNPTLSSIQKYYYLQAALKGDAAKVIESLEISDTNYTVAWSLITDRFENKKAIIKTHLKQIFDLPLVVRDSSVSLRLFLDDFQKHFRALKNLNEPVEYWNSILIHLLSSKLDVNSKKEWEIKSNNIELPAIDDFISFLNERCQLLESISHVQPIKKVHEVKSHVHVSTNNNHGCLFCKKHNHIIYFCKDFLNLSISSRLNEIRKMRACTNCLRRGHLSVECNSSSCRRCGRKHNTLLHLGKDTQSKSENDNYQVNNNRKDLTHEIQNIDKSVTTEASNDVPTSNCNNYQTTTTVTHCRNNALVILPTVLLHIFDKQNRPIKVRALLDGGSQSNFITHELFEKLDLNSNKVNLPVVGINCTTTSISRITRAAIKSIYSDYKADIQLLIINKITDNIPQCTFDKSTLQIPDDIILSDPLFNESKNIDILLGAGIFYELLLPRSIKSGDRQPVIQQTQLGWIVAGFYDNNATLNTRYCNFTQTILDNTNNLENLLEAFWRIEECQPKLICHSKEEIECEQHFQNNYQRNDSGQFIVKLPLRDNYDQLGDNFDNALQRFQSLERKLTKNSLLKEKYCSFMTEYIQLGHMKPVTDAISSSDLIYYLPHHSVQKESSSTTKLRVVFDASAKSCTGLSLNDILKVGPNIQDDIFSILLRFRTHQIVFTADIAKMYRCVKMFEPHQNLQRIIWRSDTSQPLVHYKLNTVTYGTSSASFLATRCLRQLAIDNEGEFPEASQSIVSDFYMDDWIAGADDLGSAVNLISRVDKILSQAGFYLRQWASNNNQILQGINLNDQPIKLEYVVKDAQESKTLGIYWNTVDDNFQYTTTCETHEAVTKRRVLSIVAQIFDPLGLLGPVVLRGKLILQELWRLKTGWDDEIPNELYVLFNKFYGNLNALNDLRIPRNICIKNVTRVEIHCFCDASQGAYGTCLYIRSIDIDENVSVKLVCSKSRVAPIKTITLPRLELCGALLAAKLCYKVTHALKIKIDDVYFWCDSTIVLAWINSDSSRLKTFVSNRVSQIQTITKPEQWRYVPTESNSADIISRGLNPDQIKDCSLWFDGPTWLRLQSTCWPRSCQKIETTELPEVRSTISLPTTTVTYNIISRFSSLRTLVRVIAYIIRFKNNALTKPEDRQIGIVTIDEIDYATRVIIKMVQVQEFATELKLLRANRPLPRRSKLLCLNPFLDQYNVIRVGGRLRHSELDFNSKFPILLPSKHHFTTLLIRHEHLKNLHAGPQAVLSSIRRQYWPLSAKRVIRSILHKCITCFRVRPSLIYQKMGELPAARVTPIRPFLISGVDYAGPYLIKDSKLRNKKLVKAYICLFICFASKAIHLELVGDLSSEGFLNALKRFVSRRGLCSDIYSDNGKNFVGANKCLNEFVNLSKLGEFQDFLIQNRIKWHFIPPYAPHMGGLWESAVKLAKHHLKRIVGEAHLSFDELYTILAQIESILNSRPIHPLTNDPNDLEALTPGHFLIGGPLIAVPEPPIPDDRSSRVNRYKYMRLCIQQFWTRWSRDYLHHLQPRTKGNVQENQHITKGALCIVKEDNTPPHLWRLGRIVETHPGKDNLIRVVTLKTRNGYVKRSVNELALLPVEEQQ